MASAERGISAPPEVVFNTAIDPNRMSAWLPEPLRADGRPATDPSDGAYGPLAGHRGLDRRDPG